MLATRQLLQTGILEDHNATYQSELYVTILEAEKLANSLLAYLIKSNAQPNKIHILQVYMPTTVSAGAEIKRVYTDNLQYHKQRVTYYNSDSNAKVGKIVNEKDLKEIIDSFGLGRQYDRVEQLIQFANENDMASSNHTSVNKSRT